MRIIVNIDPSIKSPKVIAQLARVFLMGVVDVNRVLMRMAAKRGRPFVPLYESGVKFRREPWAGKLEEFANVVTVYRRGGGDCDDLVGIRTAELLEQGHKAGVKIYWRHSVVDGRFRTLFHAQVRMPDGNVEDPSRYLGG